jgi:hypothetical protein
LEPGLLNIIRQNCGLQASEICVDNHAEGDQIVHGNLTSAVSLASFEFNIKVCAEALTMFAPVVTVKAAEPPSNNAAVIRICTDTPYAK